MTRRRLAALLAVCAVAGLAYGYRHGDDQMIGGHYAGPRGRWDW